MTDKTTNELRAEARKLAARTGYASWAGESEDEQYQAMCLWVATHGLGALRQVDPAAWDKYRDDPEFLADVEFAA